MQKSLTRWLVPVIVVIFGFDSNQTKNDVFFPLLLALRSIRNSLPLHCIQ